MKFLAIFLLFAVAKAEDSEVVVNVQVPVPVVPAQIPEIPVVLRQNPENPFIFRQSPGAPVGNPPRQTIDPHWTMQVREAVQGASNRLGQNMIVVLSGLAETMRDAGLNNTRAFATLTRGIVTNVVDLTSVVAYMPRLLILDLPNQFTEVLRLVRRNEVRVPSSINEAIDNILVLTRQAEESGITQRIYTPVIRFMPNILNGVHDFLQTIFTTMFTVFGAGPLPASPISPIPVPSRAESEANASSTIVPPAPEAPVAPTAVPSARYYHLY